VQALGQELPHVSFVLHMRIVSAAGVSSMKVMSRLKGSTPGAERSAAKLAADGWSIVGVLMMLCSLAETFRAVGAPQERSRRSEPASVNDGATSDGYGLRCSRAFNRFIQAGI